MSIMPSLEGMAAAVEPIDGGEPIPGRVVEIRDDHPGDDEAIRVVLETGDGLVDVAKERVEVL